MDQTNFRKTLGGNLPTLIVKFSDDQMKLKAPLTIEGLKEKVEQNFGLESVRYKMKYCDMTDEDDETWYIFNDEDTYLEGLQCAFQDRL
jgi:hypothetical protein